MFPFQSPLKHPCEQSFLLILLGWAKSSSGFSVTSYGKFQTNILTTSTTASNCIFCVFFFFFGLIALVKTLRSLLSNEVR